MGEKRTVSATYFMGTVAANVDNGKLTDEEFRRFIRRTLPIVQYGGAGDDAEDGENIERKNEGKVEGVRSDVEVMLERQRLKETQVGLGMNVDEAVAKAIKEPSLIKALTWICVWECERAVHQARFNYGSGANGAGWDTCFGVCIKRVMRAWGVCEVLVKEG